MTKVSGSLPVSISTEGKFDNYGAGITYLGSPSTGAFQYSTSAGLTITAYVDLLVYLFYGRLIVNNMNFTYGMQQLRLEEAGLVIDRPDSGLFSPKLWWGNDSFNVTGGSDIIRSFGGNDTIQANGGNDYIDGGAGMDTAVYQGMRLSYGIAKSGETVFVRDTNSGRDGLDSLRGIEKLQFSDGTFSVSELLTPAAPPTVPVPRPDIAPNLILGTSGVDNLSSPTPAGNLDETFRGFQGNDTVSGGVGDDTVRAGRGDDSVAGDEGNDLVAGDLDNDTVNGGEGHDVVRGGKGNDSLEGGAGNDTLYGDMGNDRLAGNEGADIFVFSGISGFDRITDFVTGEDKLQISSGYYQSATEVLAFLQSHAANGTTLLTVTDPALGSNPAIGSNMVNISYTGEFTVDDIILV